MLYMRIAVADTTRMHLDQDLSRLSLWNRNFLDLERLVLAREDCGLHGLGNGRHLAGIRSLLLRFGVGRSVVVGVVQCRFFIFAQAKFLDYLFHRKETAMSMAGDVPLFEGNSDDDVREQRGALATLFPPKWLLLLLEEINGETTTYLPLHHGCYLYSHRNTC